jgi:hypothetical protein
MNEADPGREPAAEDLKKRGLCAKLDVTGNGHAATELVCQKRPSER